MQNIIVVVPAYNEASVIDEVLCGLLAEGYRVVVVDDGSEDDTAKVVARHPVHLIQHAENRGQGAAIQTGLDYARSIHADVMVTFDADNQHSVADIQQMVQPILDQKVAVVFGSRFLNPQNHMPPIRSMMLRCMAWIFGRAYQVSLSDVNCGIRAFSAAAVSQITITQPRMAHTLDIIEQVHKHQLSFTEIPVTVHYTEYSLSKGQKWYHGLPMLWALL